MAATLPARTRLWHLDPIPTPPTPPADASPRPHTRRSGVLRDVALLFLRLGTTAFGGPAAHIAMMEQEGGALAGRATTRWPR